MTSNAFLRSMLNGIGYRNENENFSASNLLYQRLNLTFGRKLLYVIYSAVILTLFVIAALSESNLSEFKNSHSSSGNSEFIGAFSQFKIKNGTRFEDLHSNATSISKHSSTSNSSFWLSMMLSFISWIVFIQTLRCLRNTTISFSRSTDAASSQRALAMFLNQRILNAPEISNHIRLDMMYREFTGDDYEILQQLDESNNTSLRRGADEAEINKLPVHKITLSELEENELLSDSAPMCNICLGPYEIDDEVRVIVPCMHKYHKNCIDPWLRLNAICPICKFRIS